METKKNYSITDLVKELKLPRSTVNDWLVRHEKYIEFSKRGKRRVFFENSLKVLQEIAELRAQDKSSFEIEQELARRHPMQAEVAASPDSNKSAKKERPADADENMLPSLKNHNEELTKFFGTQFEEISKYISAAEHHNKQTTGKIWRWYLTAMVLLALLTAAFAFAVVKISKVLDDQNTALSDNRGIMKKQNNSVIAELQGNNRILQRTREKISLQAGKIENLTFRLDKNAADYAKNITELKNGLKEQREKFAEMLVNARISAEKEKIAELARQRDAFAKQQLEKLKQLETMTMELKKKQTAIEILKLRLSAKQISLDEVMRRAGSKMPLNVKQKGETPATEKNSSGNDKFKSK